MSPEKLDARYWDDRYSDGDAPWDIGSASTPLASYLDGLTDKNLRILIPGAGRAYEAEHAHRLGFTHVFPMDFTLAPLEALMERCPDFPRAHLLVGDFFAHDERYDVILEQTFFCALDPSLRGKYVQHMHKLLKPGGKLVGVLFDSVPNPVGPPFGGTVDEYRSLFEPLFPGVSFERCYNSIAPRAGRELWLKATKPTAYEPIDCNFYDHFEAAATLKETVRFGLRDGSEREGIIVDLFVREHIEWMRLKDGSEIRLDEVIDLRRPKGT
ncbi:MAG: methyltransferase domain-containing protein [Flavobacteriales bacterium]|nr:methyltransferase domain-containing protein [Flavobacteriales bacterium]